VTAYYNEIDPYAAQWLRNLIAAGHIAAGDVDERSITDVRPDDLAGYTQCHFFAGIGVWSHALRLVQWPDTRPVWTGSCPCQPFSVAGASAGVRDERHLWPHWFWLIEQCRPAVVFGEQVEAAIGHGWLDLVQADLEGLDYAVGHAGIPAAGVGAPHIRQRLWFVADANSLRREGLQRESSGGLDRGNDQQRALLGLGSSGEAGDLADAVLAGRAERRAGAGVGQIAGCGVVDSVAHHHHQGLEGCESQPGRPQQQAGQRGGAAGGVADATNERQHGRRASKTSNGRDAAWVEPERLCGPGRLADSVGGQHPPGGAQPDQRPMAQSDGTVQTGLGRPSPVNSFWRTADWLLCRDGKWRPVEPGTFPLAHGAPARVGRLRAYGNAIVPQVAAEVISAFMECRP